MIIDVHTHVAYHACYSQGFLDGVIDTLAPADSPTRRMVEKLIANALNDVQCNKFVAQMAEAGISKAILLIADYGFSLGEPSLSLDAIHELHRDILQKFPEQFEVFAGVDPRRGEAGLRLFEKSIHQYRFSGLKLYPPCGFELDDPLLMPYYEICQSYQLPVLTHTGPSLKRMQTEQRYPASILEVSKRFPDIPFILGHGGARDCDTSISLALERENIYVEVSAFQSYISDVSAYRKQFRRFFDVIPNRILFGSDWPMFSLKGTQKKWVDFFTDLDVMTPKESDLFFFENANRILTANKLD